MMISETTTEKTAPLSEAQQALADTLAKKWKKQTRIMLLAAVACTAAATGLIAAFPTSRAAVLSVPVKYAQQITVRMAVGMSLFPALISLLTHLRSGKGATAPKKEKKKGHRLPTDMQC